LLEAKKYHPQLNQRNNKICNAQSSTQWSYETGSPSVSLKTRVMVIVMILTCFLLALAALAQYTRLVSVNREIYRMETQTESIKGNMGELELKAASLSSLERLENIAREELGMKTPEANQIVVISTEKEESHLAREGAREDWERED